MSEPKIKRTLHTIVLTPDCFHPDIQVTIAVPDDRDVEEYIDEYLDSILNDDVRLNAEWNFGTLSTH